jgi:hypothetical protein
MPVLPLSPIRRDHHGRQRGRPARASAPTSTASCSTNSTSPPPWTATSSCASGQPAGRDAAGRSGGAHGVGRELAQRLVGDGEQVLNVPATLAAPGVRVLPVGHGRKSDPDDAVSVAVAARSVLAVRRVRVEDQAVVLPLLTKRRVANMRVAVTQRRAQRCADQ